jgi:hypothetical protein
MRLEWKYKNNVVCEGNKENIIKFLNKKGFNIINTTPLLIIGNLIRNEDYELYLN